MYSSKRIVPKNMGSLPTAIATAINLTVVGNGGARLNRKRKMLCCKRQGMLRLPSSGCQRLLELLSNRQLYAEFLSERILSRWA